MGEKSCNHWDDGPPFGCFQPFEEIDHRKYGEIGQYVQDENSKARDLAWQKNHIKVLGRPRTPDKGQQKRMKPTP